MLSWTTFYLISRWIILAIPETSEFWLGLQTGHKRFNGQVLYHRISAADFVCMGWRPMIARALIMWYSIQTTLLVWVRCSTYLRWCWEINVPWNWNMWQNFKSITLSGTYFWVPTLWLIVHHLNRNGSFVLFMMNTIVLFLLIYIEINNLNTYLSYLEVVLMS